MSTHFDDIERNARSLPFKQKEALARSLNQDLDQTVDAETEQLRITSHVGPHDLVTAARCRELVKANGYSVEGLAKKLKKCKTVIRDLLHLDKDKLPDVAYKALRNGTISKSIGALIVAIPDETRRAKFAEEVLHEFGEPMSFRKAKQWKEQHYMKELKGAPFPLDDSTLDPKWPYTCTKGSCPHWNGNTPKRQQGKRADICLNPPHYWELVQLNEARVIAKTENPTG